jgi:tripartite-type tricarboxylate transporter receptor subunit TctC
MTGAGLAPVWAQDNSTKPIKIIVPFPPGGSNDIVGRAVAQQLTARTKRNIIIENRPGAGGVLGAEAVSRAEPDGLTWLLISSTFTMSPASMKLPFDPVRSFVPIAMLGMGPSVIAVPQSLPFQTIKELVDYAKKNPGKINFSSSGIGTSSHLGGELFKSMANLDISHIAYKGTPEAVTEVMAGRVDWFFAPGVSVMGAVKERKLKALAVGSKERLSQLADLPTTEEAGAPNSAYTLWIGLFAPARTPPAIVARLNQEVQAALASPEVKERFAKLGADPLPMTVEGFRNFLAQEFKVSEQIVKAAGIKPQD